MKLFLFGLVLWIIVVILLLVGAYEATYVVGAVGALSIIFAMLSGIRWPGMIRQLRIPAGRHRPTRYIFPRLIFSHNGFLTRYYSFDRACAWYKLPDEDQQDVNKLFGFSFGNHLKNSVRFGWRGSCYPNCVEILAYFRRNGEIAFESLGHVQVGEQCKYTLVKKGGTVEFSIEGRSGELVGKTSTTVPNKMITYLLSPYFGGNNPAPEEMIITEYRNFINNPL